MAEEFKIIQMYNSTGAEVFPKTMAEIVKYGDSTVAAKLDALIAAEGQNNVLEAVKWNGEAFEITDKAVDIYSKVSAFVNEEIGKQIHMSVEVVEALPTAGEAGKIYLVDEEGGMSDVYVEYIWTGTAFERIGTTATDLTGYATEDFVTTAISNKVTELNLSQYATVEALNGVDKKADDNAAAIKAINESAVMTSGITAELVGKITANESAIGTINSSAVMTSGITADKVGAYDAYVAVERYSKTEADAMAEGKASAAITALDLPNTYAAKEATEQHIANNDIHVNAEQVAAIADVANKADKTVAVNGKTLSVLYFEEVTA